MRISDWSSDVCSSDLTQEQKLQILREGRIEEPSEYGDAPKVTTTAFWHSGEANRLLHGTIAVDCPVRLLHGQRDEVVPWRYAITLAQQLRSAVVQPLLLTFGTLSLREGVCPYVSISGVVEYLKKNN